MCTYIILDNSQKTVSNAGPAWDIDNESHAELKFEMVLARNNPSFSMKPQFHKTGAFDWIVPIFRYVNKPKSAVK